MKDKKELLRFLGVEPARGPENEDQKWKREAVERIVLLEWDLLWIKILVGFFTLVGAVATVLCFATEVTK